MLTVVLPRCDAIHVVRWNVEWLQVELTGLSLPRDSAAGVDGGAVTVSCEASRAHCVRCNVRPRAELWRWEGRQRDVQRRAGFDTPCARLHLWAPLLCMLLRGGVHNLRLEAPSAELGFCADV